jgi:hypothetical protein
MCVPREQEEWPGSTEEEPLRKTPAELAKSMDVFDWTTGLSIRQVGRPVRYPPLPRPLPCPVLLPQPQLRSARRFCRSHRACTCRRLERQSLRQMIADRTRP